MLKNSFKVKIIFPTVIVLVALVVILNVFLWVRFSALSDYLINEKLFANTNSLKHHLENNKANTKMAAISTAMNPKVIKAIRERDKNEILRLFTLTNDLYRVNHFTICDNEGIVLARTYAPEISGDSILDRSGVKYALDGNVSTFFESGPVVRVSVRTGAPVYDTDDSLIGVIFAGVRFDTQSMVDELKEFFNSEITVFLGDEIITATISDDGRGVTGSTMDPDAAKNVIENKREYYGNLEISGNNYKAFYMPLINADDEVFAAFCLSIPMEELLASSNKAIRHGFILGLSGLAASAALLFHIISSISKPIIELSSDMDSIANGNLDIEITVTGEDEVGQLSRSLRKVVYILHRLLVDINIMIYEHEQGNTDYLLDTAAFHGDYRILANNILDLADLGMKDQLTGIPNRRSFDSRLKLEWNRAMREKEQLSILILDVDKFKNYNDTYGHQQGDVALQTVAKALKQTIKRSVDFAARWGGEEFAVLLPTTDSDGAMRVAEKVRKEIENELIPCSEAGAETVTVSIGVSSQIPALHSSIEDFISLADSALYKAKEAGRNRVDIAMRTRGDDTDFNKGEPRNVMRT